MQADTKATTTAQVIDFKASKRAIKRQQRQSTGRSMVRVAVGTRPTLNAAQRQRRDDVRCAAKARI